MKIKNQLAIIIAIVSGLFLASCSKSTPTQPESPLDLRLNQIQETTSYTTLTVNYDIPWDTLSVQAGLATGGIGDGLNQTGNGLSFPSETSTGTKTINIKVISFTDSIRSDTILLWLQYKKLRPATVTELLTYAESEKTRAGQIPTNLIITSLGAILTQSTGFFKVGNVLGFGNIQIQGYPTYWTLGIFVTNTTSTWWGGSLDQQYGYKWSFLCVSQ